MASHPTKLFLGIYEPTISIFLAAGEEMAEMNIVTLDANTQGQVLLCGNADYPYGFCTQNVTTDGITQYGVNGLISRTAKVGDKIGVYICCGVLKTDKLADSPDVGDLLYAGTSGSTDGYFTTTAGSAPVPVGICETEPDDDGIIRFKSLL
jgi:hypothetical protein